jgi:hypothetical protein
MKTDHLAQKLDEIYVANVIFELLNGLYQIHKAGYYFGNVKLKNIVV